MKAKTYDAALASFRVSEERFDELKESVSKNARMTETAQAAGISVALLCSLVKGDEVENLAYGENSDGWETQSNEVDANREQEKSRKTCLGAEIMQRRY